LLRAAPNGQGTTEALTGSPRVGPLYNTEHEHGLGLGLDLLLRHLALVVEEARTLLAVESLTRSQRRGKR
jgi:hypothetical protein